jgi:hypothetical protein
MFLGSRVDDAITEFYRRQIAGSTMTLGELVDVFRDTWHSKLKTDGDRIAWEHGLTPAIAERMGRTAVTLTNERLIPRLGTAVAAQRKFEIRLAPALQWTVVGYVDLDTRRTKDVYLDETARASRSATSARRSRPSRWTTWPRPWICDRP